MSFLVLTAGLAWALIATAVAAAVALFVVRPRPPRLVVSSIAVWQRVIDDARERSWWDRLRWWVSLVGTALVAAALALALVRPVARPASGGDSRVLLVLDSSWSMLARTRSGDTRWARAVAAARQAAATSGAGAVALATTAEGVIEGPTSDLSLITAALDRVVPTGAAEGAWPGVAGATAVHLFTDGAHARVVPDGVVLHSVFAPASNIAVTGFDVRPSATGSDRADAFVAVANYAETAQTIRLTVTRGASLALDRSVSLAAGATHRETWSMPIVGEPRLRAHVSGAANALAIDDDASVWLAAAKPLTVAVVGTASLLPTLLSADPSLRVLSVPPAGYAQARADVWIFDRWLPQSAPSAPALIVDPPATEWFGARAASEAEPTWRSASSHEILDGVDLGYLDLARAHGVARPSLQVIAESERHTPLVAIEDGPSGRYVVLGFSTAESNLASAPAFPVLVGNAVDWLGRPARGERRLPGPIVLPGATTRVLGPDGRALPLTRLSDRVVATLTSPGLYLAEVLGTENVVTVSLGDTRASDLRSSRVPEELATTPAPGIGRAWWRLAAILALLLVGVEWFTWQRRVTV